MAKNTVLAVGLLLLAHDPGFHVAAGHAPVWMKSDEGRRVTGVALAAMIDAITAMRKWPDEPAAKAGVEELQARIKSDDSQAFTHLVRVWSQNVAKPNPRAHLERCRVCNRFANRLLRNAKVTAIPLSTPQPANRLTRARARALIKAMQHDIAHQLTAESCDLNSDGYLDGVRLDNDGDEKFDTYQLDLDHDGFVDVIIERDGKAWKVANRRE